MCFSERAGSRFYILCFSQRACGLYTVCFSERVGGSRSTDKWVQNIEDIFNYRRIRPPTPLL